MTTKRQNNTKDRIVCPCQDSSFESGSQGGEGVQAEWNNLTLTFRTTLMARIE